MSQQSKTRTMVQVALMAAVLCILSPLSIPIGPVPLSLGVLAVYLTASLLPPLPALSALAIYVLLGGVGLPVFSNFRGGPQMLVGPTGGYIAGYFVIVAIVSLVCRRTGRFALRMGASLLALALFYTMGTLWYMFVLQTTFWEGFAVCVLPFVIPDSIKAASALGLAAILSSRLEKAV